jgi:hypothetical protein
MRAQWIWAIAAAALTTATAALAGKADVVDVKIHREPGGTYAFSVTVKSDDTGWDKYADKWDVVSSDGRVLGTRVLLHPHEDEQPFTRDLTGIAVPANVTAVKVRAHDKVEGYGGRDAEGWGQGGTGCGDPLGSAGRVARSNQCEPG